MRHIPVRGLKLKKANSPTVLFNMRHIPVRGLKQKVALFSASKTSHAPYPRKGIETKTVSGSDHVFFHAPYPRKGIETESRQYPPIRPQTMRHIPVRGLKLDLHGFFSFSFVFSHALYPRKGMPAPFNTAQTKKDACTDLFRASVFFCSGRIHAGRPAPAAENPAPDSPRRPAFCNPISGTPSPRPLPLCAPMCYNKHDPLHPIAPPGKDPTP